VIRDTNIQKEIQRDWAGVGSLLEQFQVSAFASQIGGFSGIYPHKLLDAAQNLPFIIAFAVLNDVLEQLKNEGNFKSKNNQLGTLLNESKNVLSWCDFALIDKGRNLRNDLAHRGQILKRKESTALLRYYG